MKRLRIGSIIMERRKTENAALRELVDALKGFVDARDSLWTLGFFDRVFRKDKCRDAIRRYDGSLRHLREAIGALMLASRARAASQDEERDMALPPSGPTDALISHEEFTMLLNGACAAERPTQRASRWRRRLTGGPNAV